MKSIPSSTPFRVLILAIGVLAASAIPASAQAAHGKFTLSHETRWQGLVLPAGDYTFSLQSPSLPAKVKVESSDGKMAFVMPWALTTENLTDTSRLDLARTQGGESYVSALHLGDLGLVLHYRRPKAQMPAAETARLGPIVDSQVGK